MLTFSAQFLFRDEIDCFHDQCARLLVDGVSCLPRLAYGCHSCPGFRLYLEAKFTYENRAKHLLGLMVTMQKIECWRSCAIVIMNDIQCGTLPACKMTTAKWSKNKRRRMESKQTLHLCLHRDFRMKLKLLCWRVIYM